MTIRHQPTRLARRSARTSAGRAWQRILFAVLAVVAILAMLAPAASADSDEQQPRSFAVTKVDATADDVEVVVSGDIDGATQAGTTLATGETDLPVTEIASSQTENRPTELVLIIDTNARSAQGAVLERTKAELIAQVADLSDSTSVAVISAGDDALLLSRLTNDKAKITAAIESLSAKNGSAIMNAIDRAGSVLTRDPGVIRSVLVVSTGPDTSSEVSLDTARVGMVQAGAQLISVRYEEGEPRLSSTVGQTAGTELSIESTEVIETVIARAINTAADRLLVSFDGVAEIGTRTNVALTIDGTVDNFSYPAGSLSDSPLQLEPKPEPDSSRLALFRTSAGLYIAVALAFVGISMGVWALASIMAGSDATLDGLLSRYTDSSGELVESDEVDELLVQSAILQRAVSFSESFAEKRGFLARVEELLDRADLPIRAGEAMFVLVAILLLGAGLGFALTTSIIAAVFLGAGVAGLAFFIVRFLGRRRFRKFESQLPDTLQLLAGTLRAGYSLPQGMEVVSNEISDPMGQELRRAMTEARLGREIEESLGGVSERMASPDFAWAVMAIAIQREVGGNLNELLNSVADTMIARERLKREIGALTAEGKMSAGVLSFLPPGLGLVMWVMNPEYINVLFTDLLGNVLLAVGTVSALIGLAWMKKVITIDV